MKGKTSIIDVPKKAEQPDLFGIEKWTSKQNYIFTALISVFYDIS